MRKFLPCLPLVGLPAFVHYLVPYLIGLGYISSASELYSLAACLLLPFIIGVLLALLGATSVSNRLGLCILMVVIQFTLLFTLVPGSAKTEMMGLAQRVNREFSADDLKKCAADLRKREQAGTLVRKDLPSGEWQMWFGDARVVNDSQLPQNLRGKFQRVLIDTGNDSGPLGVFFELETNRGILCSTNRYRSDFWRCSVADGVYACRYVRP
jgi:hypothetical protein